MRKALLPLFGAGQATTMTIAWALRRVVLHKLMEEFLTGELEANTDVTILRAGALLLQLVTGPENDRFVLIRRKWQIPPCAL